MTGGVAGIRCQLPISSLLKKDLERAAVSTVRNYCSPKANKKRGSSSLRCSVTGPTFCTKASERVYITTSSGKDANGGAQGAVGDRRAAICGANAAGAGGL